jgi:hypothetical protein
VKKDQRIAWTTYEQQHKVLMRPAGFTEDSTTRALQTVSPVY